VSSSTHRDDLASTLRSEVSMMLRTVAGTTFAVPARMHEPRDPTRRTTGLVLLWISVACFVIGGLVILAVRAEPPRGFVDGMADAFRAAGVAVGFGIVGLILAIIGAVKRWTA
jgi:hypothetical protein